MIVKTNDKNSVSGSDKQAMVHKVLHVSANVLKTTTHNAHIHRQLFCYRVICEITNVACKNNKRLMLATIESLKIKRTFEK